VTRPPQLALALLGTVITVVFVHYARNVDQRLGAASAAAYGVQGSAGSRGTAGPRAAEPEVVLPSRGAAMPAAGGRGPVVHGGSNDADDEAVIDTPDTEPPTLFGIALPAWLDDVIGRRRPAVGGGMPVPATATPAPTAAAPSSTAAAGGCQHDPAPHPQGITAEVDFVGVLLNGQQREGDSFTGAELDDLRILVEWKSLLENHAQRVDLIAPDGSLYQSLSRLVTAADTGAQLETRVPVNGSWITRYGLYGSWCVEIFIDQESAPVASSRLVIAKPQ
jgi:hypothetical protein